MGGTVKKTLQLIMLSMFVKVLGFLREILLANYYGTTATADVFITSLNIPSVIFALFGTAITTAFIPLYSEIKIKEGDDTAIRFSNNVMNILVIVSFIVSILGIIFSDFLVKVFAGGFKGEEFILCSNFIKIIMITIVTTVVQYVYNGYLQTEGKFNQQSLMNIPYSLILIITIILSYYMKSFYSLAIGALIANLSQIVYLRILIRRTSFRHKLVFDFHDTYIKRMIMLVGPVFVSTAINQLNQIVDRNLASGLREGSISALNYSNKINSIILEVIVLSIATVIFPSLSRMFAENKKKEVNDYIVRVLNVVAFLGIPFSVFIGLYATDIVSILYGRGAFGPDETAFVSKALVIISMGIFGSALRDILNRIYYAKQDTKTPVINGIISVLMNIVLNLILVKSYEYLGLAFATVFSTTLCSVLLMISLFRKDKGMDRRKLLINYCKISVSVAVTYILMKYLDSFIALGNSLSHLIIMGIITIAIYIGILIVIKESIANEVLLKIKKIVKQ